MIGNVYTHATDDDAGAIRRDAAPTNGQPRPTSDKMSDTPNRATRELASELARHLDMDERGVYDYALCALSKYLFNLDELLRPDVPLSARQFAAILRQIPSDLDGHGPLSIQVPASAVDPLATVTATAHPVQ